MSLTNLALLPPGQSATIMALTVDPGLERRLYALGFHRGQDVQVLRRGGLSGPLHVRVRMTEVMLRRCDACQIEVMPLAG